eukprot:m.233116 g.233116  ORF g.233116 m.233116 type:complete len:104 (+) comp13905_c2_seq4:84-395(+)
MVVLGLGLGRVLLDLGNTYLHTDSDMLFNGAVLFFFLIFTGPDTKMWQGLTPTGMQHCLKYIRAQLNALEAIEAQTQQESNAQIDMVFCGICFCFCVHASCKH